MDLHILLKTFSSQFRRKNCFNIFTILAFLMCVFTCDLLSVFKRRKWKKFFSVTTNKRGGEELWRLYQRADSSKVVLADQLQNLEITVCHYFVIFTRSRTIVRLRTLVFTQPCANWAKPFFFLLLPSLTSSLSWPWSLYQLIWKVLIGFFQDLQPEVNIKSIKYQPKQVGKFRSQWKHTFIIESIKVA